MDQVLIIDDDTNIIESYSDILEGEGFTVFKSDSCDDCVEIMREKEIHVVLLDVFLGKRNGIDILRNIREISPEINVIMISGASDIKTAIKAVRLGAFDFLEKPVGKNKLCLTVKNAFSDYKHRSQNTLLRNEILKSYSFYGESREIHNLENLIKKASRSAIPILILGENGTGKEIVARRLHYLSNRASKPFVAVNCASIPKDLLESELFGYKKGAFTGADRDKEGFFLKASGGTLFLDEIGDMNIDLQAKLLRVLEENEVVRLGDSETVPIDVRILSATNQNLQKLIRDNLFREDLYYRLQGLQIHIPPLRKRPDDVLPLVNKFAEEFCYDNNIRLPLFSENALNALKQYSFPGNVRELKNIVHRTLILNEEEIIESFLLPQIDDEITEKESDESLGTLQMVKHRLLEQYIKKRLEALEGDKKELAHELGIHINNLYRILRDFDL